MMLNFIDLNGAASNEQLSSQSLDIEQRYKNTEI